ncbi:MAG: radical SAM protein [Candidatus Cloacimonetes bacterium]|nr:radical SAM protein [Candidatus Cloacimonadota bacterium]
MIILPVFLPHWGCHHQCIYCNQKTITGKSRFSWSETTQQIHSFLEKNRGQSKEVAFFGGSFAFLDAELQVKLFQIVHDKSDELTGIRFSTTPDSLDLNNLQFYFENQVKTIELGVQSFDDDTLTRCQRNYTRQDVLDTYSLIRKFPFRIILQLMPGLPGFTTQNWQKTIDATINLHPEGVRIYPAIVLKGTKLAEMYFNNEYLPLTLPEALRLVAAAVTDLENQNIPVIKTGLHSDLDRSEIVAGPFHPGFGELVRIEIIKQKIIANFRADRTLVFSPLIISYFRGYEQKMIQELKMALGLRKIPVKLDPDMEPEEIAFLDIDPDYNW